jgi:hypothetical protein
MELLRRVFFTSLFILLLSGIWTEARVEEIEEAPPFPPGKNVQLVNKLCTSCHNAEMVYMRTYDEKSAKRYYEHGVSDTDPEREKKVIEYLLNVLGDK